MGMGNSDDESRILEEHHRLNQLKELGLVDYKKEMTEEERIQYESNVLNRYRPKRKE